MDSPESKVGAPSEDLREFAANLRQLPQGYWISQDEASVSFPPGGHEACFFFEDESFWFRHRNAIIVSALQLFPPGGTVFDVGGGNGYVARGVEAAGFPVVLVEPGAEGAANAVKRGLGNVVCSTVEAAGFRPSSLPAVGLFDVLEHVEDDRTFLAALKPLLKTNGRIYLTVPAYRFLWSVEDDHTGHYRRYSVGSLRRCIEAAGFVVEHLTYFFWFLPLPVLVFRTIPWLVGLRTVVSTERSHREHGTRGGMSGTLIGHALRWEARRLESRKTIPFGGSCLAVARKTTD